MRFRISTLIYLIVLVIGLTLAAPFVSSKSSGVYAQNSISGFVTGLDRRPVSDVFVELVNDNYQTIGHTRTNATGRYTFSGMSEGRYTIRVLTQGTDYEEAENEVYLQNVTSTLASGREKTGAPDDQESDFHLKLRRGVIQTNGIVFAQDIPPDAKKLYDKAIEDLDGKRNTEGLAELRSALEIFPKYYAALERLGTEYLHLGSPEAFQAAEILFALAVEVNTHAFNSWYGLAYARFSSAKYDDALVAAQKAVEINATSPDAVCLSGTLLLRTKKYAEAEKQLLKAKELSKDSMPQVHWELALLYGNSLKRYADAANELKLFLKAKPDAKDAEKIKKVIADFEAKAQKT